MRKQGKNQLKSNKITLFNNGVFSQWHICNFKITNINFNSAEQFMMYSKAMLFQDKNTANLILKSSLPYDQKALGRIVKNYDEGIWHLFREGIVFSGNFAKFSQNEALKTSLINTKDTIMAEASVKDKVWGIGLSEDDPRAHNIHLWKGQNLLGLTLMKVRGAIKSR